MHCKLSNLQCSLSLARCLSQNSELHCPATARQTDPVSFPAFLIPSPAARAPTPVTSLLPARGYPSIGAEILFFLFLPVPEVEPEAANPPPVAAPPPNGLALPKPASHVREQTADVFNVNA